MAWRKHGGTAVNQTIVPGSPAKQGVLQVLYRCHGNILFITIIIIASQVQFTDSLVAKLVGGSKAFIVPPERPLRWHADIDRPPRMPLPRRVDAGSLASGLISASRAEQVSAHVAKYAPGDEATDPKTG